MKKILLLLFLLCGVITLYAQELYAPKAIVKGRKASYYCYDSDKMTVSVRNILNVDTTWNVYYMNGTKVPEGEGGGRLDFKNEDLIKVFKEVLTSEELNKVRGKITHSISLIVSCNNLGVTQEISFRFRRTDPVMSTLSPDRLYQLEEKLKKATKLKPTESIRNIRNHKYFASISYREIK